MTTPREPQLRGLDNVPLFLTLAGLPAGQAAHAMQEMRKALAAMTHSTPIRNDEAREAMRQFLEAPFQDVTLNADSDLLRAAYTAGFTLVAGSASNVVPSDRKIAMAAHLDWTPAEQLDYWMAVGALNALGVINPTLAELINIFADRAVRVDYSLRLELGEPAGAL